ncbi:MAG: hypothetical protein IKA79_02135 [Lentisphaeria bacterium]|nr:hypothetical protein [Lentisphaeria bacterium]
MDGTFILPEGELYCGCNYWASHAGTSMWSKWDASIVEKDLKLLASHGMTAIRVFPLWSDFQPVNILRTGCGNYRQYCGKDEKLLPPDADGMDEEMLARFGILADLAQKYHLKLIVGLLTGWMSGRYFVPPVLEGRNLFTDAEALRWEGRFIRTFVGRFKNHPAIIAWEPGNECNCLGSLESKDFAAASYHWMDYIVSVIRSTDPARPVYSGLHGCSPEITRNWNLNMLGELCDGLTTHPYPLFTPHCGKSSLTTLPAILHSTAETLFYRGLSGKMTFIEEIGTLGPCMLSEEKTASYMRTAILSACVHNCRGFFWWCAFDQTHLSHAPYCWEAVERELGLFHADGKAKPAANSMKETLEALKKLPFKTLPPRKVDALVIPASTDNKWLSAYGTFLLSKQAGFEVEFASVYKDDLPEYPFYILSGMDSGSIVSRSLYNALLEKVKKGSSLLITDTGNGILHSFKETIGSEIEYTSLTPSQKTYSDAVCGTLSFQNPVTRVLTPVTAKVLLSADDRTALLTVNDYGKGKIFYLSTAPELTVLDEKEPQIYHIYRKIARLAGLDCMENKPPQIGVTTHEFPDGEKVKIELNYSDKVIDNIPANGMRILLSGKVILFPA